MLTTLGNLKPGEQFIVLNDPEDLIYTVQSEPIDGEVLCSDEDGFAEMFKIDKIVRKWPCEWVKSQLNDHFNI